MKTRPRAVARIVPSLACLALAFALSFCLFHPWRATPVLAVSRKIAPQESLAVRPSSPGVSPVLVELFTSEGCSSCPPADALLARLDREQPVSNANIIVLSEHVDYWDSLGWKDRFSSPDFTQRQKDYSAFFHLGDVYTPQAVVNGSVQLNGSDAAGIEKAIRQATSDNSVPLRLTGVKVHGDTVTFSLQNLPATPGYVNVYAALVDPADSTAVRAGENKGRTLRHAGVVRTLARVGSSWRTDALGKQPFGLQANLSGTPETLSGMRLVVFIQTKHVGPVLGAISCTLVPDSPVAGAVPANPCPLPGPHGEFHQG